MSLTALIWVLLYVSLAAASVLNPLYGALGYLLEYYMRPALKWWGDDLPVLRYNLIISMVLGLTFALRRTSLKPLVRTPNFAARWLVCLLAVMIGVTFTTAIDEDLSVEWVTEWSKMAIIFPMLAAGVIRTRQHFNAFVTAHVLGAFWWGWEAYRDPKREAGRLVEIGSGDSLQDNGAAAHLVTTLPFALIYAITEKNPRLRAVGLLATPFIINTLILCNSRGSMVGLGVAGLAGIGLIKSGYRMRTVTAVIGMVVAVLLLADPQFIRRQQTTANPQDGSAQGRLVTWQGALELVKDHPFGTGGRGFHLLSPKYIPEIVESHGGDLRAPHNTYAMVASEWGALGLICFIGIYASAFLNLRRVKRAARPEEHGYFYWRAFGMQLALIAFLVAASFTDRLYAEAGYWLVGLSYALLRIQRTEHAENVAADASTTQEALDRNARWTGSELTPAGAQP
ncbi:O-antigen ligase [Luteitalea sp.]|uniref:O-antigen ligase family protein n=1 Tax=Luteitalea sp. TaxID=2004800 RepID=UPI0025BD3FA1|nr:O-antigen ligase family protein [Luteitalea sp.]